MSTTSNPGFRQVFSPGVHGVVGLGDTPFTFGVGLALAPELRSIDMDGGTSREVNAPRVQSFMAVDISIFPF